MYIVPLLLASLTSTVGFVTFYQKMGQSRLFHDQSSTTTMKATTTQATAETKAAFGSKFLPDISEEELNELFKEFNITNFDLNNDPELKKWAPSKEFFELYGFQNNTQRYKRKTMDVKMDFYNAYRKPILPQYKTFIADFLAMTFIQTVDARYKYDALHAFGVCTQYYTIMKGYPLQDEIDVLFNTIMAAVGLDPALLRADAKRMLTTIKSMENATEDSVFKADNELGQIFESVRKNRFFKYTDAWGVGLGRVMELVGVDPKEENFARWCKILRWVFVQRVMQTWDEFTGDQLKMQGIEAMQKQLLIREKRRAAARLEKQAAEFEDKKKSIFELNEAIAERRATLIEEQKVLKKRFEPENYEQILLDDPTATPAKEYIADTNDDA